MKLLTYPQDAALLARKARPVREDEFGSQALEDFGRELATLMLDRHALGLAATQVDTCAPDGDAWAVFAIRVREDHYAVMCNPVITLRAAARLGPEACLSFESVVETLSAPDQLALRFRNLRGNHGEMMFSGLHARAANHEIEHLNGMTMLHRMSQAKRALFLKAVQKRRHKLATMTHVTAQPPGPRTVA
jgi:peptide deformylase